MSVIYGKINFNQQPLNNGELFSVEEVLNHWDADRKQIWANANAGLGHLMLYNTPESLTEQLPFYKSDSRLAITADARLDNRDELFKKLNLSPAANAITDSSIILAAYEKYGNRCVEHLIGDFSFAIWDEGRQQLFCARDHLGVKPFFYYRGAQFFVFASEKKGILAIPGVDRAINKQFVYNQLIEPVEQAIDATLYQHIMRLPPGHTLVVNAANASLHLRRYWTLDTETELKFARRDDYYDGLLDHFTNAVKCRLRSHFDVGAQLSGGIDSSAITSVAATLMRKSNREIVTLSNTLPDGITDPAIVRLDERKYIDEVIRFNQINKAIYITHNVFDTALAEAEFCLQLNDGLEMWNANWLISLKKAAQQHNIRTLLSGFPGDELITFRGKYNFMDHMDHGRWMQFVFSKDNYGNISKWHPIIPFKLKYGFHQLKTGLGIYNFVIKTGAQLFDIPKPYLNRRTASEWENQYFKEQFKSYRHLQKYRFLKTQVTQRMESETRYGINFRTEPRFPMADIRLAQYYLSMPNDLKYEGSISRTAFRRALKDHLPQLISDRDNKQSSIAPFLMLRKFDYDKLKIMVEQLPANTVLNKPVTLARIAAKQQHESSFFSLPFKQRRALKLPSWELLRWLMDHPSVK